MLALHVNMVHSSVYEEVKLSVYHLAVLSPFAVAHSYSLPDPAAPTGIILPLP